MVRFLAGKRHFPTPKKSAMFPQMPGSPSWATSRVLCKSTKSSDGPNIFYPSFLVAISYLSSWFRLGSSVFHWHFYKPSSETKTSYLRELLPTAERHAKSSNTLCVHIRFTTFTSVFLDQQLCNIWLFGSSSLSLSTAKSWDQLKSLGLPWGGDEEITTRLDWFFWCANLGSVIWLPHVI